MIRFFKEKKEPLIIKHNALSNDLIPPKKILSLTEITLGYIKRICFRGDSREPQEIFLTGFKPRSMISKELYDLIQDEITRNKKEGMHAELIKIIKLRHQEKGHGWATPDLIKTLKETTMIDAWFEWVELGIKHGNIVVVDDEQEIEQVLQDSFESNRLVAVSSRFKAATLFPISTHDSVNETKKSWIYVVHIDKGFDVHMHGVIVELMNKINGDQKASIPLEIAMKMYINEIITVEIPPEKIICAVEIKKVQGIDQHGYIYGHFELDSNITINPTCTLSKHQQKQTLEFVRKEITLNKKACKLQGDHIDKTLPSPYSGFSPSM